MPPEERVATFDNDGTLWSEQPLYFQFIFALDRVKALAPQHPEWKTKQPFKAVLEGDKKALAAAGEKGRFEILLATHTGMTTDEFAKSVADWIATARHPRFDRPYTDLVFQPMVELLAYMRANGFKTFIVSAGTVGFMRVWAERVYGIPPEQVVGTTLAAQFKLQKDGVPVLWRQPKIDFIDDGRSGSSLPHSRSFHRANVPLASASIRSSGRCRRASTREDTDPRGEGG